MLMTIKNKTILATLAAIVIVSTTVFASMQTSQNNAYGQQATVLYPSRERTISVTGTATTSVLPDLVTVQFGVDRRSNSTRSYKGKFTNNECGGFCCPKPWN